MVTDYAKLTNNDLWIVTAKFAGWTASESGGWSHPTHGVKGSLPGYPFDLNAARELEDEIERRNLQNQYLNTLIEVTGGRSDGVSWRMTTASSRDRAIAFCRVMDAQTKPEPEVVLEGIQPR